MRCKLSDVAVEVEIAFNELAESLCTRQDEIPNADYILTKLAMACYKKGLIRAQRTKTHSVTEPQFRPPREDDTPLVVIIRDKDLLPD